MILSLFFLLFNFFYHVIVTVLGYGILGGKFNEVISLFRDRSRLLLVLIMFFVNIKKTMPYLKKRWKVRFSFGVAIVFGIIMSLLYGKGLFDIFIGIKYGFYYILIFLTASFVGYAGLDKFFGNKDKNIRCIRCLELSLFFFVVFGFVWQIAKMTFPEIFLAIGYGGLDDFIFGQRPPIYYQTTYEGTTRRQGFFSGPNNYGYFLVIFLPLVRTLATSKLANLKEIIKERHLFNLVFLTIWILAIAFTLSRTAIIGGVLGLILLNIQTLKKYKKYLIVAIAGLVLTVLGLSLRKSKMASTLAHIKSKISGINYVIQKPLGYGLGTSGPAVHHNGTILPENYYLQLTLDVGTIGFILWLVIMFNIILLFKQIQRNQKKNTDAHQGFIYIIRKSMTVGWVCLLTMGLLLHVFEDGMVNYLFFIPYGILTGWLSREGK